MPNFLGEGPGHEDGGGTAESVGSGGLIFVVGVFIIARNRVVFRIF